MTDQPKKNNTGIYIAIGVAILLCCCCITALIIFFGYDSWGDPLGIYGSLQQLPLLHLV